MLFVISKADAPREYTSKGETKHMQKVTLHSEADGKDYKTTMFTEDEVFVGDSVEAMMKEYNEKYHEYSFNIKQVTHTENPQPNKQAVPSIKTEGSGAVTSGSDRETCIVRQACIKAVADLFSGKGEADSAGMYIALAETFAEWCLTGSASPRIDAAQRKALIEKFGPDTAREVVMAVGGVPYVHMLTEDKYDQVMSEDPKL